MTASVRLEPYTDDDRWLTRAIETDPAMMGELGGPISADDVARVHVRRIRGIAEDRLWYFKVVLAADGTPVGTICLWPEPWEGQQITEAGWAILPEFQGRGLATAALHLLVRRAAEDGRWGPIHAFTGVTNAPSNAVCRKGGFQLLGEARVEYAGRTLQCNHWVLDG